MNVVKFAVLGALLLALVVPSVAEPVAMPTVTSTTNVGTLRVEKYGSGQPALILVPGLGSGAWVWDSVIREFSKTHTIYALTLAGFDGLQSVPGPLLDKADAGLLQLVRDEHIDKPVIVGHSMGGFLALRFAEEHPDLLSGVASVDGLPVFPTMAQLTAEQRVAAADRIADAMCKQSRADFDKASAAFTSLMVSDPKNAQRVAALASKSDQQAMASYMDEMLKGDLRPGLSKISVPLMEVAPVSTYTTAQTTAFYSGMLAGAPKLRVVPVEKSRHFVMIDQPDALNAALRDFLTKLSKS